MGRSGRFSEGRDHKAARWGRPRISAVAVAASVTLLALMTQAPSPARAAQAAAPVSGSVAAPAGSSDAALDVVMLVDESGSETDANVAEERQTAGTIAQTLLNPRSRVTVVGFGGVNHVTPDQNPVNVACQPTTVSSPGNLSYLSTCVNSLHRRSEQEGDDTDYAAALGKRCPTSIPAPRTGGNPRRERSRSSSMMTDGGLDVHRDQEQYGQNWLAGRIMPSICSSLPREPTPFRSGRSASGLTRDRISST